MRFNEQKQALLTADMLRQRVTYDPETGRMIWIAPVAPHLKGREAGFCSSGGYRHILFKEGQFQVHRLIWLYVHGEWPSNTIDHVNCVRDDNRLSNLRVATPTQNLANRPAACGRKLKGITRCTRSRRWIAQIRINGRNTQLGRFDTPEEAHAAYAARAIQVHGEFARV